MLRRVSLLAVAAALAAFIAIAAGDAYAGAIQRSKATFLYDGRPVRVEFFRPAGVQRPPAALVLHGASGIGQGWYVYPFAEALARRGVAAAVVHYYDGLGKRGQKASPSIFEVRDDILEKAIDFVLARKDVRSDGLGIYGMSLGGYHALSLGARDERIRAVVSLGGALSNHISLAAAGRLPHTLLIHGSRDRVVPFERALAASHAIEQSGAAGALKIYKGEGHSLSQKAHADAVETVARFLSEGLRKPRQLAESKAH